MPATRSASLLSTPATGHEERVGRPDETRALQKAIFDSVSFSNIATDAQGVIQIFNVGAQRLLGYTPDEARGKMTLAAIFDAQEMIVRAQALSQEYGISIASGFEALAYKPSRGIEDIFESSCRRKDGSHFPALISVTALRDPRQATIGFLLILTDISARKRIEGERKNLDQRLRDQQFYTRALLEASLDARVMTDRTGTLTEVNKAMEALTGCTRDELIGEQFAHHFTDPQRAEAGIKRALSEKRIASFELTARHRDGRQTEVSLNATTFHDRDRNPQGVFASLRDITERRKAEALLWQTEELKRAVLDSMAAQVAVLDRHGVIVSVNKAWLLFARENSGGPAELAGPNDVGVNYLDICRPVPGQHGRPGSLAAHDGILSVLEGRSPGFTLEYPCHSPTRQMWFSMTVTPLGGAGLGVVIAHNDISESKAVEMRLIDSQSRLKALLYAIPDLVWFKDPEGVYLSCNQRFEDFFGASEKEIVGRTDFDFVDRELAEFFRANDRAAMEKGKPSVNQEWIVFASDGHRELLETTKTAVFDSSHRLIGVLGISHDITARHQAALELEEHCRQLARMAHSTSVESPLSDGL